MKKTYYILDGMNITEEDITFAHIKRGFLYGDGIFETLRATNYKIFMWEEHLKRLEEGAKVCGLEAPKNWGNLREHIEKLLKENRVKDAYIRINLWRQNPDIFDPSGKTKTHTLIIVRDYHPYPERIYRQGISCIISKKYFRNEKSPLVYIKSLNYLENILARIEAKDNKCDDAIMLNTSGYLSSGTVSNIFFVRGGVVYTPSIDCGILKGTIRGVVMRICKEKGIKVEEGKFTVRDLEYADEIFFTNTLMGILPVREVKGIFKSRIFTITNFLKEWMEKTTD